MPHYRYSDWAQGEVLYTVKQTTRAGIPWADGPYHQKRAGKVIFECDAPDILTADAMFTEATARIPAKEFSVGCAIT